MRRSYIGLERRYADDANVQRGDLVGHVINFVPRRLHGDDAERDGTIRVHDSADPRRIQPSSIDSTGKILVDASWTTAWTEGQAMPVQVAIVYAHDGG